MIINNEKNKLNIYFFQSYLKKEILEGKTTAQICLSEDDIPNFLLPSRSNAGTVNPIKGPATYQGQGCFIHCIISIETY